MKVYFNAFWNGFHQDINTVKFFIELFKQTFNEECTIDSYENSELLCESLFGESCILSKSWKYSILYSGESRLRENSELYTIILYSQLSHKNIVNCPVFFPYIYCNNLLDKFETCHNIKRFDIPKKDIVVIISNTTSNYIKRLEFIELLDKEYNITYAGSYKNNIGGNLTYGYGTEEFSNFNSNFKFIISMENSIEETYITEKICHGINAKNIPIYWGTDKVKDYFNIDRYVLVDDKDYNKTLKEIRELYTNESKWLNMVNQPTFTNNKLCISFDNIVEDMKKIIT